MFVGTAGWSIPRVNGEAFPVEGTGLERYAARLPAAEINSSFYRPHRVSLYERWAASVPEPFRFSVKMPKTITHLQRLTGVEQLLDAFLSEVAGLGRALGCLLVQLPPSLAFDEGIAGAFFTALRERHAGDVVVEPRNASWFDGSSDALLVHQRIGRVAADPARVPAAADPGGSGDIVYFRLHGSPRVYFSAYDAAALERLDVRLRAASSRGAATWCIFDNTASGAATANALALAARLTAS